MTTQYEDLLARLKASTPEDKIVLVNVVNARRILDEAIAATAAAKTEYWIDKAEEDRTRAIIHLRALVRQAREFGISIDDSEVFELKENK
jgi:hypothetical protein